MGAWGHGPFDNDTAADWVYELTESQGPNTVIEALAITTSSYLDVDEGTNAIAAAEVVAAALGQPAAQLPDEVLAWLASHGSAFAAEHAALAALAVDRVMSDESELRELWDEAESNEWRAAVANLRSRL